MFCTKKRERAFRWQLVERRFEFFRAFRLGVLGSCEAARTTMASTEEAAAAAAAAATAEDAVRVTFRGGMAFVPGMRPISVRRRRRATRRPTHSPRTHRLSPRSPRRRTSRRFSTRRRRRRSASPRRRRLATTALPRRALAGKSLRPPNKHSHELRCTCHHSPPLTPPTLTAARARMRARARVPARRRWAPRSR